MTRTGRTEAYSPWRARTNARTADLDHELTSLCGAEPSRAPLTGIKALMVAVLDNGITSYLSPVPRIRTEAEYWVHSRSQRSPFSFQVVCETLGLEPDAVRAQLRRSRLHNAAARPLLGRPRPNVRRPGRLLARKVG